MRLRNKKTGEIGYTGLAVDGLLPVTIEGRVAGNAEQRYRTLAELNEDWEDYEEPKKYWYIYGDGVLSADDNNDFMACTMREIGNYFETKKEAEKAVEKLKAWKRLKDKGFRFYGWNKGDLFECKPNTIEFACDGTEPCTWEGIQKDLDICFGGEE